VNRGKLQPCNPATLAPDPLQYLPQKSRMMGGAGEMDEKPSSLLCRFREKISPFSPFQVDGMQFI